MIKKLLYMEAVYKHKIKVGSNNTMEGHFGPPFDMSQNLLKN